MLRALDLKRSGVSSLQQFFRAPDITEFTARHSQVLLHHPQIGVVLAHGFFCQTEDLFQQIQSSFLVSYFSVSIGEIVQNSQRPLAFLPELFEHLRIKLFQDVLFLFVLAQLSVYCGNYVFIIHRLRCVAPGDLLRLVRLLLCPVQRFVKIQFHTDAAEVHLIKLMHRLRQPRLAGRRDQRQAAFAVRLHVDAVEVGEPDQVIMRGIVVVFRAGNVLQRLQKLRLKYLLILHADRLRESLKPIPQLGMIRPDHLSRQHGLSGLSRHGIFRGDDVIIFIDQVRSDQQREKLALFQSLFDALVKALARGQELVVPDGDVTAHRVPVDQAHQLVRVDTVLLPVAQENVGVKGGPHSVRGLGVDQDGGKVKLQFLLVGDGAVVRQVRIQILQLTEAVRAAVELIETVFEHDGQDRDMMRLREGEVLVHGAVRFGQQPVTHRDHEKVHAAEVGLAVLLRDGRRHVRRVVDSAVRGLEDVAADTFQRAFDVRRMACKIHSGFALGTGVAFGLDL